jgi:predicted nucleotidyltransferase
MDGRLNMQNDTIENLKRHLPEIKEKFKVKEIGLFGSYVKGNIKKSSDIDVLVEFEEGYKNFDNYMELRFYLEDTFKRKVDLVLKVALKEEIKPYILKEVVYV